jgi:hypothetical protein
LFYLSSVIAFSFTFISEAAEASTAYAYTPATQPGQGLLSAASLLPGPFLTTLRANGLIADQPTTSAQLVSTTSPVALAVDNAVVETSDRVNVSGEQAPPGDDKPVRKARGRKRKAA